MSAASATSGETQTTAKDTFRSKVTPEDVKNWHLELVRIEEELKREPENLEAMFDRARLLWALDRFTEARLVAYKLSELNPTFPDLDELKMDIDASIDDEQFVDNPAKEKKRVHHPHRKYRLWR